MSSHSQSDVLRAVEAGDIGRVRGLLLEEHADSRAGVGLSGDSDLTALQLAALYDQDVAKALLERGAACDLHSACALGLVDEVRRSAKAGELAVLAEHLTPMGFAILQNRLDAVRALLDAGDDPNRPLRRIGFFVWELEALAAGLGRWSPLHAAATHGYAEDASAVVAALLDAGAERDAPSSLGERAVHLAAVYGWKPVLNTLIDAGADVDSRTVRASDAVWRLSSPLGADNVYGSTPAMLAVREGGVETLGWLLARGASVDARDSGGSTLLHVAARPWWGEKPELASVLLAAGADPRAQDASGRTPYDVADAAGFTATAALLS